MTITKVSLVNISLAMGVVEEDVHSVLELLKVGLEQPVEQVEPNVEGYVLVFGVEYPDLHHCPDVPLGFAALEGLERKLLRSS